jgi:hypothetical protein
MRNYDIQKSNLKCRYKMYKFQIILLHYVCNKYIINYVRTGCVSEEAALGEVEGASMQEAAQCDGGGGPLASPKKHNVQRF